MTDDDSRKEQLNPPKESREEQARQVVQEYIDDQKALIKKIRKEL
ncbi:hypothetical protein [Bradyrhizobium sp. CCBAU 53351]|nr:hypothetical protein [Bradyrhizobium sp. CCBAU 53351]